jgi:HrpA-like RNA helicase
LNTPVMFCQLLKDRAAALPEIMDADLAPVALQAALWGAPGRTELPWFQAPPDAAWRQAVQLLHELEALGDAGRANLSTALGNLSISGVVQNNGAFTFAGAIFLAGLPNAISIFVTADYRSEV